ncbi:hypothetical protein CEXT_500651 [Caerostris extrusa]|uniref:Uncharacterized protein n=1 Tax=Caerostris extrusa TaxID=172846 RepID=A0AAV4NF21_CAEEX|nr:hypothetical protein CEXT_500651 [Caerostris extrusa]
MTPKPKPKRFRFQPSTRDRLRAPTPSSLLKEFESCLPEQSLYVCRNFTLRYKMEHSSLYLPMRGLWWRGTIRIHPRSATLLGMLPFSSSNGSGEEDWKQMFPIGGSDAGSHFRRGQIKR